MRPRCLRDTVAHRVAKTLLFPFVSPGFVQSQLDTPGTHSDTPAHPGSNKRVRVRNHRKDQAETAHVTTNADSRGLTLGVDANKKWS